jgi:hypothetical protein
LCVVMLEKLRLDLLQNRVHAHWRTLFKRGLFDEELMSGSSYRRYLALAASSYIGKAVLGPAAALRPLSLMIILKQLLCGDQPRDLVVNPLHLFAELAVFTDEQFLL